jgi:hypothetical protein
MPLEGIRARDWVAKHGSRLQLQLLLFHSSNDTIADISGSEHLVQQASSSDKELRRVDHMWHILPKEPGNEALRDQVADCLGGAALRWRQGRQCKLLRRAGWHVAVRPPRCGAMRTAGVALQSSRCDHQHLISSITCRAPLAASYRKMVPGRCVLVNRAVLYILLHVYTPCNAEG